MLRRKARVVNIGRIKIGAKHPIAIQSMVKTKTKDAREAIRQIARLKNCGCDIVRLAVKDFEDAGALKWIKQASGVPLVADIHFNWRLAIEAIKSGVDKIRLNPGNINKPQELKEIVKCAKDYGAAIRVGVNSGSLLKSKLNISDAMVKSALDYIKRIEDLHFFDIVVSLKASDVLDTINANRKVASICDYPIHLGVTATGAPSSGLVKSSIAIGILLSEGIGDTIRISLTADPLEEVAAAKKILETLNLKIFSHQIISCPTCGRCDVDLVNMVKDLEDRLSAIGHKLPARPMKLAVMGCVVNGPGEAKEADLGIAFGKDSGLVFKRGKPLKKAKAKDAVEVLLKELKAVSND